MSRFIDVFIYLFFPQTFLWWSYIRLWGNKDVEDTGSAISHGEETQTAVETVGAVGSALGWRVLGHAPFCPVQAQALAPHRQDIFLRAYGSTGACAPGGPVGLSWLHPSAVAS